MLAGRYFRNPLDCELYARVCSQCYHSNERGAREFPYWLNPYSGQKPPLPEAGSRDSRRQRRLPEDEACEERLRSEPWCAMDAYRVILMMHLPVTKGSVGVDIGGDFSFADIGSAVGEASFQSALDKLSQEHPVGMLASGRTAYLNAWLNLKEGGRPLRRVLLPSYLCYSMLSPFQRLRVRSEHYRVLSDLSVDIDDLSQKVSADMEGTLVVVANYFGFPEREDLLCALSEIRRQGGLVLYDATHSTLCERPWPRMTPGLWAECMHNEPEEEPPCGGWGGRARLAGRD